MTIDYSRLRSLSARSIAASLEADGFRLERQTGAHRRYVHKDGRAVTLSYHKSSETFTFKTLKSIIQIQARWEEEDLQRLGLL